MFYKKIKADMGYSFLSLRQKTVLIVGILFSGLISVVYFYSSEQILNEFKKLESADVESVIKKINLSIYAQSDDLSNKLTDWTQKDEPFQRFALKKHNYLNINLDINLRQFDIDLFSFWSSDKKLLWGKKVVSNAENELSHRENLSTLEIDTIEKLTLIHSPQLTNKKNTIFIKLNGTPYLLISIPIYRAEEKFLTRGNIIAGIKLNNHFFQKLSLEEFHRIELVESNVNNYPFRIDSTDKKILNVFTSLVDYKNDYLLSYQLKLPRNIYQQSRKFLTSLLVSLVFAGTFLTILAFVLVDKLVISKLLRLNEIVLTIKQTNNLSLRVPNLGHDEIGLLAKSTNQMLDEIEKLRAEKYHSDKMISLGEMASGIAHEINNPITIINASTFILKKNNMNLNDKYIQNIDRAVQRISQIMSGLKAVSTDPLYDDLLLCPLKDIISDALVVISEKLKSNGVKLNVNLEGPLFLTQIKCVRAQMSQVFLSLLNNSFEAIKNLDNKWINIEVSTINDSLVIRFIDSGEGITQEIRSKIFQPFFTTKEIGEGPGLGLSLSFTIIKRHLGDFYFDEHFQNTCFVIKLPLLQS